MSSSSTEIRSSSSSSGACNCVDFLCWNASGVNNYDVLCLCNPPCSSGNYAFNCGYLSDWKLYGVNPSNSDNCTLYFYAYYYSDGTYGYRRIAIYKDTARTQLVASASKLVSGYDCNFPYTSVTYAITEENSSGISGTAEQYADYLLVMVGYGNLSCDIPSSSTSSDNSSSSSTEIRSSSSSSSTEIRSSSSSSSLSSSSTEIRSSSSSSSLSSSSTEIRSSSSSSTSLSSSSTAIKSSSSSDDYNNIDINCPIIVQNNHNLLPFSWIGEKGTTPTSVDGSELGFTVESKNSTYLKYTKIIDVTKSEN